MPSKRWILTAACAVAAVVAAPAAGATAAPEYSRVGGYVALGDSYSAGVGAPPYTDPGCRRSDGSYAPLLAEKLDPRSFSFAACSGDTTADLTVKQLPALDRRTALVTITVGGNDIGFANGIGACLQGTDADCAAVVAAAEQATTTTLPAALDGVYRQIRARAPHARLLVLGYPDLFELTPDCATAPLSLAKRTALNEATDVLDGVIAQRARRAGATFVDARAAFAGHGVCSADPWINGLTNDGGAFHPNATGYAQGYLAAVGPFALPHCRAV